MSELLDRCRVYSVTNQQLGRLLRCGKFVGKELPPDAEVVGVVYNPLCRTTHIHVVSQSFDEVLPGTAICIYRLIDEPVGSVT